MVRDFLTIILLGHLESSHSIGIVRVKTGIMEVPVVRTTKLPILRRNWSFPVIDTVLPSICLGGSVDVESMVVVCQLIHEIAEGCEVRDDRRIILIEGLSVLEQRLT